MVFDQGPDLAIIPDDQDAIDDLPKGALLFGQVGAGQFILQAGGSLLQLETRELQPGRFGGKPTST